MPEKLDCRKRCVVVLPSLNPNEKFDRVVDGLREAGFQRILIVDDGSDEQHQTHFRRAETVCPVFRKIFPVTKKIAKAELQITALGVYEAVLNGKRISDYVLAPGWTTYEKRLQVQTYDITGMLEEGNKIILGCRDFDLPGVPPRSVAGNKTTSRMFRLYGITLSDTQTGLRAIPARFLSRFTAIEGERFEYETNMLLKMKRRGIGFLEQPIATVYEDENLGSHYNAVKDSWRIFKIMVKDLLQRS